MDSHNRMTLLCKFDARGFCTVCEHKESAPGFQRNCCGSPGCMDAANRKGLGDYVSDVLRLFGITKERAQAVSSAVGVKDCGCSQRQEALNELGRKIGIG